MNYADLRETLKTGDIVLFSGKGGISEWIKWFTRSQWSHVGMVVRAMDMVLLLESTSLSKVKDVETGRATRGVQLVGLRERLAHYNGSAALRGLNGNLSGAQLHELSKFRSEVSGRPYEQDKIELLRAAVDINGWEQGEDLSSLFCSELVAEAYQRMGLLDESLSSNEYTPKDFAGILPLQGGFCIGPPDTIE